MSSSNSFKEIKWLVVVNPNAANGYCGNSYDSLLNHLQVCGFNIQVQISERSLHIAEMVKNGIEEGYKHVMAIGGDGTNNEAINGIFSQQKYDPKEITYVLIPVGTGNDWIKQFSIPSSNNKWIEQIKKLNTKSIDVGRVDFHTENNTPDHRYFINIAGFAYDAYIVKCLESIEVPSQMKYFSQALKGLFKYRPEKGIIKWENQQIKSKLYTFNVGLGKYSGGGMQLVPHGSQNNGKFAITVAKRMHALRVLAATPKFYNGEIEKHPRVTCFETDEITIDHTKKPIGCEVDGEWIGYTPCKLSILPKALKIIVP